MRSITDKKGMSIGAVIGITLGIAVLTILAIMIHQLNEDVRNDRMAETDAGCNATNKTTCGFIYNVTLDTDKGISKVSNNLDLVGLAVAFGLVISIIVSAIAFRKSF